MSKPVINVTPLIDVLLVLLIIFMVISPTRPSQFEARLPSEPTNHIVEPNPYTIVIAVDPNSRLKLNNDETDASVGAPDKLITRLQEIFKLRSENLVNERTVFIKAPRKLDYGSVVHVVDAVKLAGGYPISLQIDSLE